MEHDNSLHQEIEGLCSRHAQWRGEECPYARVSAAAELIDQLLYVEGRIYRGEWAPSGSLEAVEYIRQEVLERRETIRQNSEKYQYPEEEPDGYLGTISLKDIPF